MLLSGANKSTGSSTLATSTKSTKSVVKKKDGFVVYTLKQFWSFIQGFWTRFRKCMWVGSTGNK
jgi:hypothetical protein